MRHLLPTALIIALISPSVSDAQVKKSGGFFGFNRNQEQISSGLFPSEITGQPASQTSVEPATSAPTPPSQSSSQSEGIFRGGSPSPVAPVSYTIENGQKIEKGSKSARRSSLFGFGKKDKTETSEAPIVSPVPAASPYVSPTAAPVVSTPAPVPAPAPVTAPKPKPAPAIEWSAPAPALTDDRKENAVAEMEAETPTFKTEEKETKSGGFFSFFNRKKSEPDPVVEIPTVSPPVVAEETATAEVIAAVDRANENVFEVPSMPNSDSEPKKDKKGFAETILAPVSKMRPSKKELDFTGAETIIANGEIITDDGQSLADRVVTMEGDGVKEPPKMVNGVKTYSSWEDVEGSTVSAADKIIKQIR